MRARMDPIAHTLVGAAAAQTGLGRRSAYATAALVIGANLPDIDGVATFLGGDSSLYWRRGWTHGILALVLLPLLLTALLVVWSWAWSRAWSRAFGRPPPRPRVLLGLSYLAVWSHPSLDWLNTYGVRWLMPFDGTWFYGDTLFVVDSWFWLILAGAVFLFRSRHVWSLGAWTLFAVFFAYLLFGSVQGLVLAKAILCVAILGLIVLRVRRVGYDEPSARRVAAGAFLILATYIGVMHSAARDASQLIRQTLAERGEDVQRIMVGPVRVTPFVRDVVVETPDGYIHGTAHLFPALELDLARSKIPLLPDSEEVGAAIASPGVRGFVNWARFPFAEVEETSSGCTVFLLDARYTRRRGSGFGSARVHVAKD